MNVLLLDRAQPHRHRPLDHCVLKPRHPHWPLAAILLVAPRPLHRRRRRAPTAQPLVPVGEVRLEGFRLDRGRHPLDPRRRLCAGPAIGFPAPVNVPQVRQRREPPRWLLDRLRRYPLECRGDGWWPRSVSPRSSQPHVLPGVAFPPVGPVGLGSPPSRPAGWPADPRSSAPLRLPRLRLGVLRLSLVRRYPGVLLCFTPSQVTEPRHPAGLGGFLPRLPDPALPQARRGSPTFPRDPSADMPRSQTPVVPWALALAPPGLLPSGAWKPSAFPSIPRRDIPWPTTLPISGLTPAACPLAPPRSAPPFLVEHVGVATDGLARRSSGGT